jgi:hypothetical protein
MTDCASTKPRWVQRVKWTQLDGTEREKVRISAYNLDADELEALGHEALQVAAEWRKEITERVPAPPTYKVFAFTSCYGGSDANIATWVEHPWALVRVGKGTSIAFLVKGPDRFGAYQARIAVAGKDANGSLLRWKLRYESATTVSRRDLLYVLPCALPYNPSLGDLEYARANAQRGAA